MSTRINFNPTPRRGSSFQKARRHALPTCATTGLVRFRDRHQARDGAKALAVGAQRFVVSTFSCPDCRGWHVEKSDFRRPAQRFVRTAPSVAFADSLPTRRRRYFLVDIENLTSGAKASCAEVEKLWKILKQQAPGIAPHDHVVVGASRSVASAYRKMIAGPNVKWVVGANVPDGADHALLAAIDLYRVAQNYDELVIASGDHAFTALALQAKAFGLSVQVVAAEHFERRSMLSRQLRAAADIRTTIRHDARPTRRPSTATATTAISGAPRTAHRRAAA